MKIQARHEILGSPKRILLIQLGDIGDIVWTWPAIYALKAQFPGARLSLLTRKDRGCLLDENPLVHEIIEIAQSKDGWLKSSITQIDLVRKLRENHFDLVIDLRGDERGAFTARLSGAPMRASVFYKDASIWRNRMFTHLAAATLPGDFPFRGPAEHCLGVLRPFGIDVEGALPLFPVPVSIAERADSLLRKMKVNPGDRFVTISPYSRWKYKEWPQEKWIPVIHWLWERWRITSVIVGGKEDWDKANELKLFGDDFVCNLAGETALAELAGVIHRSLLHVGVDTGGPHLAAALGLPTVTICGPSFWEGWAHSGSKHRVVFPDKDCVPCHKIGCENSHRSECLEELDPQKVQLAIGELLVQMGLPQYS
jgi:ADP-heptose:LPS heptosyltransferase